MKTTIIAFVTYGAIFLLVGALLYFFAFWRPNANRVYQLNQDIEAARANLAAATQMNEMRPQLEDDLSRQRYELYHARGEWERVSQEWQDGYRRFLPDFFNDVDVMDRIIRIVEPHSHNLNIDIHHSRPLMTPSHTDGYTSQEGLWLTPVHISFTASYDGLITIFYDFAHAGIDNRVVDFSLNRENSWWDVTARIDMLSLAPQADGDSNGLNLHPPAAGDENGYEYQPYYPYDGGNNYYPPQDYYEQPDDPADNNNYSAYASGLVGTWLLMDMPFFVFESDGSGTMGEIEIHWSSSDDVIYICIVPQLCGITDCLAAVPFEYALDGNQLTVIMEGGIPFTYTRQ